MPNFKTALLVTVTGGPCNFRDQHLKVCDPNEVASSLDDFMVCIDPAGGRVLSPLVCRHIEVFEASPLAVVYALSALLTDLDKFASSDSDSPEVALAAREKFCDRISGMHKRLPVEEAAT